MNWSLLLLLACPLTMVFCMGSLFRFGKKQQPDRAAAPVAHAMAAHDLKTLQMQVADLMVENHQLKADLQELRSSREPQPIAASATTRDEVRWA